MRDLVHSDLPVSGYDILELLKVSSRYRAKEEEEAKELGDEKHQPPSGKTSYISYIPTDMLTHWRSGRKRLKFVDESRL